MRQDSKSVRPSGFSLIELVAVLGIMLVVAATAVPMLMTSVNGYRLRTSTVDLNGLLQRARQRAVQDNRSYTVRTASVLQGGTTYTQIYLDLNGNSTLDTGEPMVQLQRNVSLSTGGGIPTISNATLGFTPQPSATPISFNGRGTPCVLVNGVCSSWDSAGATPNPVGFIYYVRATAGSWSGRAAVSISPSGRFRVWNYYNNTTWGY